MLLVRTAALMGLTLCVALVGSSSAWGQSHPDEVCLSAKVKKRLAQCPAGLKKHGHRNVTALESPEALPELVGELAQPGDLVVCLGAGNITQWANALPGQLDTFFGIANDRQAAGGGA